ncbi:MAG TPA: cytochrome c peroxidase [Terriglobales bacterium]|nr:cytochrome c peroxidase [Terriglobales bacterium]
MTFVSVLALAQNSGDRILDRKLQKILHREAFTGRIESTLEARLHRKVNPQLADLGRLLFFDVAGGLHDDNTCAGCHSPSSGLGDTQSIAIGVQSNLVVGPDRTGPRNQRRTPSVINTAFYPKLMWNGRFLSLSGDPFDNSQGFQFPLPEGTTLFPPNDPVVKQLLVAQAHIPPTELVEVAGFTGTAGQIGPRFDQFDDGLGSVVPPPDNSGFRNEPIRQEVLKRLNGNSTYRELFGMLFPEVAAGGAIDFTMFGRAIAEFEFTQVYADAPLDKFARGDTHAMTNAQKRGALIFFGKGKCSACHTVGGQSNEMFSDFLMHNIAVPQIAPFFGVGQGNVIFDGVNEDEDFGQEQISGELADRYKFRSSPLRNAALQPAFFHNGAFTRLEDAIRHHLDVEESVRHYNPVEAGVALDLTHRLASPEAMLKTLDPLLKDPIRLSDREFRDLVSFVRDALLDERAFKRHLCPLIPDSVPSGMPLLTFEGCSQK